MRQSPKEVLTTASLNRKGVDMLDQFFRPMNTTPKNRRLSGSEKETELNNDKGEGKIRKPVEIKFHQAALPAEESSYFEKFPFIKEYYRIDTVEESLHRHGLDWTH